MPNDSRSDAQYSLRFFVYLGMLLLVPMGGMAENSDSVAPACSTVAVEEGTEIECSVDLSAHPGVSSIRYQYVSSSTNSEMHLMSVPNYLKMTPLLILNRSWRRLVKSTKHELPSKMEPSKVSNN